MASIKKNVLIIHLESISNTILWQYRAELGTAWRLMQMSRRFTRFYSSATSTIMAYNGMLDGASDLFDSLPNFSQPLPPERHLFFGHNNLFGALHHKYGYHLFYHQINYYIPPRGRDQGGMSRNTHSKEEFIELTRLAIQDAQREGKPFCGALMNLIPHMAMDDEAKQGAKTFSDRFRQGYLSADALLNRALALLVELGVWENTLIVCYGDHGDEMWSHGLTRGYSHGFAPYASLTWTPCFFFDNGRDAGDDDRLMSMIDLKHVILGRLLGDSVSGEELASYRHSAFSGMDVGREKRDLAFSQNLYALQLEYGDLEEGMTKNYAVTDGVYRLVAASGGKRPKDGGLELYYDRLDPANSRNLLDFFVLNSSGEIAAFSPPPEAVDEDFALAFNPEAVAHMIASFHRLRKALYQYVREKEAKAMKERCSEAHVMPESAFLHARKRLRRDYDE